MNSPRQSSLPHNPGFELEWSARSVSPKAGMKASMATLRCRAALVGVFILLLASLAAAQSTTQAEGTWTEWQQDHRTGLALRSRCMQGARSHWDIEAWNLADGVDTLNWRRGTKNATVEDSGQASAEPYYHLGPAQHVTFALPASRKCGSLKFKLSATVDSDTGRREYDVKYNGQALVAKEHQAGGGFWGTMADIMAAPADTGSSQTTGTENDDANAGATTVPTPEPDTSVTTAPYGQPAGGSYGGRPNASSSRGESCIGKSCGPNCVYRAAPGTTVVYGDNRDACRCYYANSKKECVAGVH